MNASKKGLLLVAALSLAAAYGCAKTDDESAAGDQTENEIALRSGSVDQAAIVESTTMMMAGAPTAPVLDAFNEQDPFSIQGTQFAPALVQRLAQFDGIDGKTDWTADQTAAWTGRLSTANYLVVDTSKPCDFGNPRTYLEIERAALTGRDHATCGGRMPNEDALDVTLNFLVRGPGASVDDDDALHDGVEQATHKSGDSFPYLAEMNGL